MFFQMHFSKIIFFIILSLFMSQTLKSQDGILDRTKPPKAGPPKDIEFPEYYDTTLSNGINLLVIENHKIPAVSVRLVFKNAGSFQDGSKYGSASITAELLTKGTKTRSAIQIAEEIDFLGASLSSGSDWDGSYISLSVLKKFLNEAAEVLADVVLNPVFDEEEISRVREQRIASILQGKDDANILSDRMFNKVVFENTPYSNPHEGTEESIKSITKKDLNDFYTGHYKPSNLILAFVGAISPEEALQIVNDKFGAWKNNGLIKAKTDNQNNTVNKSFSENFIYIVDKPGAVQSNLRIGHIGIERNNPDFTAVTVMNTILGGYFGSRINLNLREKHGFTYGARSGFNARILPGDFSVDTDVRNEVTDTSIKLIVDELKRIISEEVTDEEMQTVKNYLTGLFPLQLETANAVATRVINLNLYNLPKDYYSTYISALNKLTKKDILNAAKKYIHPENLYIVVSGSAEAIKEKLETIKSVKVFDADGNQIQ
jgi:zinc protease